MTKKVGLLTAGSDCPGLNAAVRAIGKEAQGSFGMQITAFQDGFQGLVENRVFPIDGSSFSGILSMGGTILGTSRDKPDHLVIEGKGDFDGTEDAIRTYQKHHLDCLVCIGGKETQEAALYLMGKGLNVITLPKAIDNDVAMTDTTIGFDTALEIATESIDRLHSTALSHHRILIVELMGRNTGWLTLGAGMAGGADVIIIPEIAYDPEKIAQTILTRSQARKNFSIIAVAENIISQEYVSFFNRLEQANTRLRMGEDREKVAGQIKDFKNQQKGSTTYLANRLEKYTGLETRIAILGYILRGGAPSARDRLLATQLGTTCVSLIVDNHYGVMVASRDARPTPVPLDQVVGKAKPVPLDHPWIISARRVGTSFGD
ncbi:MAG TPA: ATP-dependent 6-phosphofructokinase [Anaerolineaceae bacterium]